MVLPRVAAEAARVVSVLVVAVLVEPGFRDVARVERYVRQLAEKHPGAIVASAGTGMAPYAAWRAAIDAGLRVAAFESNPDPPGVAAPARPSDDEDAPRVGTRETTYRVTVGLLSAEHRDSLWTPEREPVGVPKLGRDAGETEALWRAWLAAGERVVFAASGDWPPFGSEGAQVLGP